ncbi:MAG: hypothetical protein ISS69_11995 [Phycisphaerae bacterium]|nr:hypothetical protein [Phycisphaerae bacterium]
MISRGMLVLISAVVVSAALPGCRGMDIFQQREKIEQLTADLESARAETKVAQQAVSDARSELARKQKRIDTLVGLGPDRLKKLYYAKAIKLGQYTGGADLDAQGGDDGIKVFLRPIDANGDTIKAAGSVTVQLYDLGEPADKTLIGQYKWSVDEVAKAFSGGFLTYHFSFTCPWKTGPPKHDEITVRVEFVDYLTGKTMSVQKVCKVDLSTE